MDWALLLEGNEILGENMTFIEKEREIASITQVINNFYAVIKDIEIQQGKGE